MKMNPLYKTSRDNFFEIIKYLDLYSIVSFKLSCRFTYNNIPLRFFKHLIKMEDVSFMKHSNYFIEKMFDHLWILPTIRHQKLSQKLIIRYIDKAIEEVPSSLLKKNPFEISGKLTDFITKQKMTKNTIKYLVKKFDFLLSISKFHIQILIRFQKVPINFFKKYRHRISYDRFLIYQKIHISNYSITNFKHVEIIMEHPQNCLFKKQDYLDFIEEFIFEIMWYDIASFEYFCKYPVSIKKLYKKEIKKLQSEINEKNKNKIQSQCEFLETQKKVFKINFKIYKNRDDYKIVKKIIKKNIDLVNWEMLKKNKVDKKILKLEKLIF